MLIRSTLLVLVMLLVSSFNSFSSEPQTVEGQQSQESSVIDRSAIIAFARNFLGAPYRYASASPTKGFDCSGFVNYVFKNFKIALPRSSREFTKMGKDLKPEEFQPGDVVVFYSFRNKARIGHVGIICEANGMKSKFIHASSGKVRGITVSDLASATYSKRFFRCVDVIENK